MNLLMSISKNENDEKNEDVSTFLDKYSHTRTLSNFCNYMAKILFDFCINVIELLFYFC